MPRPIAPGVLQGFWKCPNGCDHDILVVGSPIEISMLLHTMRLGPETAKVDQNGEVTAISTDDGTYLTLRPAISATDWLTESLMGGKSPF